MKSADDNPRTPLCTPWLGEPEIKAVNKVLQSGWVAQGPVTASFEKALAGFVGARHAVAVSSGTAALHLCLLALGIEPGDEVLVPSHSFVAVANVISYVGAVPVFVDIQPDTYNMDPTPLDQALTSKTRAVCPVHQVGLPVDLDPILAFAQAHRLKVYEDAACALGSEYKGRRIGSHSPLACFSFHPRKLITTGEGGMVTTDSDELAENLRVLRHQGMTVTAHERHRADDFKQVHFPVVGYNYRMTDIQSAIGLAQLERMDEILKRRNAIAARYEELLGPSPHLKLPVVPDYAFHNYQSYVVRLDPSAPIGRDQLVQRLMDKGIGAGAGVGCVHREAPYRNLVRVPLPHSEAATDHTFMLPLYPQMTDDQVQRVVEAVLTIAK